MIERDKVRESILRHSATMPLFAELQEAGRSPGALKNSTGFRHISRTSFYDVEGMESIPLTTYYDYREYKRSGDRKSYEAPYFLKRGRLSHAAIDYFITGDRKMLDHVLNLCVGDLRGDELGRTCT